MNNRRIKSKPIIIPIIILIVIGLGLGILYNSKKSKSNTESPTSKIQSLIVDHSVTLYDSELYQDKRPVITEKGNEKIGYTYIATIDQKCNDDVKALIGEKIADNIYEDEGYNLYSVKDSDNDYYAIKNTDKNYEIYEYAYSFDNQSYKDVIKNIFNVGGSEQVARVLHSGLPLLEDEYTIKITDKNDINKIYDILCEMNSDDESLTYANNVDISFSICFKNDIKTSFYYNKVTKTINAIHGFYNIILTEEEAEWLENLFKN